MLHSQKTKILKAVLGISELRSELQTVGKPERIAFLDVLNTICRS